MLKISVSSFGLIMLFSCTSPSDGPEQGPDPELSDKVRTPQGRYLLGETLDSRAGVLPLQHVSVDASSAADASGVVFSELDVVEGYLQGTLAGATHAGDDPAFVGMTISASDGSTLRISGAMSRNVSVTEYQIEVLEGGNWESLCLDDGYALPFAGIWDETGRHAGSPGRITFACADGVASKCVGWGYAPWLGTDGRSYHQACTRMARADVCGLGQSNTFSGTEIEFADMRAPAESGKANVWPGEYLPFEAAWRADPASPLDPLSERPLCLSKRRWQTLPLGGYCADVMPDPRLVSSAGTTCEDYANLDEMADDGALIFNGSGYYDAGLYMWTNATETLTTTTGYCAGVSLSGNEAPAPGFLTARYQGIVLTEAGATLATNRNPAVQLQVLRTWQNGQQAFVSTTGAPPAGYDQEVREEGRLFASQNDALAFIDDAPVLPAPLYLYHHPITDDYLTSTDAIAPIGYTGQTEIGWVLRPIVPGLDAVCTVVP